MTPHDIEHTEKDVPGYVLHLSTVQLIRQSRDSVARRELGKLGIVDPSSHPTQSTVSQLGGNKVSLFTVTAAVESVRLKHIADR
jgi:hypothetical protein